MTVPSPRELKNNKTAQILRDAENGGYGVVASIVYVVVGLPIYAC